MSAEGAIVRRLSPNPMILARGSQRSDVPQADLPLEAGDTLLLPCGEQVPLPPEATTRIRAVLRSVPRAQAEAAAPPHALVRPPSPPL